MASGSQNMTTYNARIVTGSNSAASPAGALLLSGAGRADDATGDTWIFLNSLGGLTNPWGIKHDEANNKLQIFGSGTNSFSVRMDTGDTYILGKVGIGYNPETSGNTYKLYVDGSTRINSTLHIFPNSANYTEGIRIHSYDSWSDIILCGNDNTGDTNISANSWFIGNNNGNFHITRNGSSGDGSAYLRCVSNVWAWNGTANGNISGNAETVSRATFGDSSHGEHNANNITSNGLYYYQSNGPATSQGAKSTDGALYAQAYNTAWVGQIAQDYRNGYLFIRGKNNGSWTSWLHVLNTNTGVSRYHVGSTESNSYILVTINPETSWMFNFTLKVYQSYIATDIQISGYNYGTNHWYSPQARILGSTSTSAIKVYFGYTANWKLWVAIDGGSYNGADVVDMCNGYTQIDPANAFTVTKVNSLPGTTQTTVTAYRPWYRDETVSNAAKLLDSAHSWTATDVYNYMTARVLKAGDTMTGTLAIANNSQNHSLNALLYIEHKSNNDWGIIIEKGSSYDYGLEVKCNSGGSNGILVTGRITGTKVYGAVWNDYAECRNIAQEIQPGRVVYETGATMQLAYSRLQSGCRIISDTYGMCIGETEEAKTPIAVTGRVLVYPYRARTEYELGAAVCSAPNGTVDIMTREEIMMYPERIIGTVSEIPDYEIWHAGERDGNHEIQVNGRIWIYVR